MSDRLCEIDSRIEELRREIERLENEKKRLLVEQGKGYFCKQCGAFVGLNVLNRDSEHVKEGLCYLCWKGKKLGELKERWRRFLVGARIVDVEPYDPSSPRRIDKIIVEKDGKRYEIVPDACDGDLYMELRDLETGRAISVNDEG